MNRFTEDMYISDIIKEDVRAIDVLKKYGMNCGSCNAVFTSRLKDAAIVHDVKLSELLKELNSLDKNKSSI